MSGISKSKLQELAAHLSDRDHHILRFLEEYRYATSTHIRRMLFTDHATETAAIRACIRVLDRLLGHRLVARLDRRVGGTRRGSAGYVWYLDCVGERLTRPAGSGRRRFDDPSTSFLDHTLEVTETAVQLHEIGRQDGITLTRLDVEPASWRSYLNVSAATSILKPDLFATLSTAEFDDHWYIEVDRGTESVPVLLAKCRAYVAYRRTGAAQAEHGVFPRVLWVVPTQRRVARLEAAIHGEPDLPDRLFRTITPHQLTATLLDPDDVTSSRTEPTT